MINFRPRIAIPARLAESSSVTRYEAIVTARKLAELIWDAGGEPLTFLPVNDEKWESRLEGIDGILMPGGADVDPKSYGQGHASKELYGINALQDQSDISLVNYALQSDLPLFTICRGTQIANVALGGTLILQFRRRFGSQGILTFDFMLSSSIARSVGRRYFSFGICE